MSAEVPSHPSSSESIAALVLCAGLGSRMKSDQPKGLHKVCGEPMVGLVVSGLRDAGVGRIIVVIGKGGEAVQKTLGDSVEYVWQTQQLGTGDAVKSARELLKDFTGTLVVTAGDTPLVTGEFFANLIAEHQNQNAMCTVGTAIVEEPNAYGRIVRSADGSTVLAIVEKKECTPEQEAIKEVNSAIYCVSGVGLFDRIDRIQLAPSGKEYYFTDIVQILNEDGEKVVAYRSEDSDILVGVNDRWSLTEANEMLQERILKRHADNGVTIVDRRSCFVGPYVKLDGDVTLHPNTIILGRSSVGKNSEIGPNTRLVNVSVGQDALVIMANAEDCDLGDEVKVGPFANIRPKSVLGKNVNIGNFVEVNRSRLDENVKVRHLTYIGDSEIGVGTNVGAGTITCNYDGFVKSKTIIGKNVFIGSHSTLVAPVTIGDNAMTVAGSTITADIPAGGAGFGRARQETKPEWAARWRERRSADTQKKKDSKES